jgi:TrmH family RNA methyltransferase
MADPPELIRSRRNPLVRRLHDLKEARRNDACLLEGPRLVLEALGAGTRVLEAAVAPRAERVGAGREALAALARAGTRVLRVHEDVLAALSEAEQSQGLLAIAERPRFDADRLFAGIPLVLVAVGVQNPGNLGGLLRTAEAAGATGALLTPGSADPFSWKALRGSMGSAFRLPLGRERSLAAALDGLKERGLRLAATSASRGVAYDQVDWRGPAAVLLGNEAGGLPEDVLSRADLEVRIPLRSPVDSLNVGVAAGILLFEAARQRANASPRG